ncbi:hypothetical protein DPMN_145806 [Dreissena polymorpha]|uniref:Sushi domain-containing protein n=1 Tax=Dreissena polymorpha TaxID=45954 RepID=A0A9D4F5W2_DREPO|nr:hypothetical protein DPMN_145806 [Dreissena polymorpha]
MIDPFIGPLVPGAVVTFSCAQGYSPMRNNFLRCDSGGAWIGTPVCVRGITRIDIF